ncbi:hypothetical protein P7C70_g2983, partial [Phenoliferia sp. Uapishka_3]
MSSTPTSTALPPAIPLSAPRVIPGFKSAAPEVKKSSRSRTKKPSVKTDVAGAVSADGVANTATAPDAASLSAPLVATPVVEQEPVLEETKTAVEAVHKRLRSANKKIQRIVTYEEKTGALNADQQKAIASKPALEATVKELQELLVILKAEEADNERRQAVLSSRLEKHHAQEIAQAVAGAKTEAQSDVVLLLQFIHLYGLYTAEQQGFAPRALPPAVANATGQEVAGVRCLYDAVANGPLLGGHGDALEKLALLASGSSDFIIEGVSYLRIKELMTGMTAPPAESPSVSEPEQTIESSQPATANDSVVALVDGSAEPTPSFLQASELNSEAPVDAEEKVASWADDVAEVEEVPVAVPAVPEPAVEEESAPVPAAAAPSQPLDWSAEDNSEALPSLEGLAPQAPAVPVAQVESDGFQTQARGGRRGGPPPAGGRGSFRGAPRGAGGYRGRGGPQGGAPSDGNWTRQPRVEGEGSSFRGRGGYQGGERGAFNGESRGRGGRGRGEGRGRGGPRGGNGPNGAVPSPAAASPAPSTPVA